MYKIAIVLILFGFVITPSRGQDDAFIKDYVERLENSRSYLILVAETMSEKNYSFKPTDESWSFAENLMHIGWAMDWHSQTLLAGREARVWETDMHFKVADKSKKEMILVINQTFDAALKVINEFDISQLNDTLDYFGLKRSKRQILMLLADHVTHHRAQLLVYLRIHGLVPPRYVLFQ